jgi:antitoxin (DNA-binding transcriptional repressor) of toxin-antitoxin stability system
MGHRIGAVSLDQARLRATQSRVYRNGQPVADIVPVKATTPAWKKPPQVRLSLGSLSLGDEVLADRDKQR